MHYPDNTSTNNHMSLIIGLLRTMRHMSGSMLYTEYIEVEQYTIVS